MAERVLIVGFSTRALAESASRAGYHCLSVDAFGDLDQKSRVTNVGLVRDLGVSYTPGRVVAVAGKIEADEVAYVGSFENHPGEVESLAAGRLLLGNGPETLRLVRDTVALARVVMKAGGKVPETVRYGQAVPIRDGVLWLRKPALGGGGAGVREWRGKPLRPGEILQERVEGLLMSVAFASDGKRAAILGFAEGLAGDPAFGAPPFRYAGSLYPCPVDEAIHGQIEAIVREIVAAFHLCGVNGVDFIVRCGDVFVLEVNPRYSASMELLERRDGRSVFEIHRMSSRGQLPPPLAESGRDVFGKAVLWARRKMTVRDTSDLLTRDDVRDIPFPGEEIPKGHPICTVFASGPNRDVCYGRLQAAADGLDIT
jgi:predicted ATP-grasp superfamily ATP-dependent carboligase